jgi:hypothetical protein
MAKSKKDPPASRRVFHVFRAQKRFGLIIIVVVPVARMTVVVPVP